MLRFFACQDAQCKSEHEYCHTCFREVCSRGEADVHRSLGHEVQQGGCSPRFGSGQAKQPRPDESSARAARP
jgi:hypothetical protein